ncbi:MAG: dipeptide epimerase [Saprospiraceae bacterium]|nr:dipeptide epimerase [Saprospiraceae bacterium]
MKITAIRPFLKQLALTTPYTIAYETCTDATLVFLEIELQNGMIGLGSASPSEEVVGENPHQTLLHLQSDFLQQFVGRDIRHFQQLIFETCQHFPNLPGTQAAVDIALHDAFGQFLGVSVADFYGRKMPDLPTSVTIGIMNVAETLESARNYHALGFRALKVKTGLQVEEDIERVLRLHELYKGKMTLRVDANQGYHLQDLRRFIATTAHIGLELIEQPLPAGKEQELLILEKSQRSILVADESLHGPEAALTLCQAPSPFGIFNIKLMKCGGIMSAFEIANIARNAGISLFWGCNDESIVSITAALHAAYACPNTRYLDLDGSFDLVEDLVEGGFMVKDGMMQISSEPGLGLRRNSR